MPAPDERTRTAWAVAALVFAVAAPTAYVAQRLYEVAVAPAGGDPALVIRQAHTAFYWRVATASWWAGLAAALVVVAIRHRAGAADRVVPFVTRIALPWAIVLAALAWLFP